jgi:leucyl/phenylalanyl-tRNA--protein transferase
MGTWITDGMRDAYALLHRLGHAHSVEVFDRDALVGGIYGVSIGRMFFGESMFSARPGGSKMALAALARRLHEWQWPLIDAQVESPHLVRLGAQPWPRPEFLGEVRVLTCFEEPADSWTARFGEVAANGLAA